MYVAMNKLNRKRYVGKTEQGLQKRKGEHVSSAKKGSNLYFHNAIRKYGVEGFTWEVIYRATTEAELNQMEKNFIRMFKSTGKEFGYNLTHGGEGGIPNETTRAKLSAAQNGKNFTEETRAKLSAWQKGRKLTEVTKRKISEAHKGKENPRFDPRIYALWHKDRGIVAGTKYDLCRKYGFGSSHLSHLIRGKCKSCKGFILATNIGPFLNNSQ